MSKHESGDSMRTVDGNPGDQIVIRIPPVEQDSRIDEIEVALDRIEGELGEILEIVRSGSTGGSTSEQLLDKQEVASYLGVSTRQVDRLRRCGRLPAGTRVGARLRWRRSDLSDLVDGLKGTA